jgi:hypothetical protein
MQINQFPAKENIMVKGPTNKLPSKIRFMLPLTITITDGNPYAFYTFIITGSFTLITCHYTEMWYRIHQATQNPKHQ